MGYNREVAAQQEQSVGMTLGGGPKSNEIPGLLETIEKQLAIVSQEHACMLDVFSTVLKPSPPANEAAGKDGLASTTLGGRLGSISYQLANHIRAMREMMERSAL